MKSYVLEFFLDWSCRKIGYDQPKVIIWTILVLLKYPMLHIKFQGNRSTSPREGEF